MAWTSIISVPPCLRRVSWSLKLCRLGTVLVLMGACFALAIEAGAEERQARDSAVLAPNLEPTPLQDDATLRDVAFAGETGLAVGDHGTVWKSSDGGQTWTFLQVGPDLNEVTWEAVCLVTDKIGWIAGGHVVPYVKAHVGVIYQTTDGGVSWQPLTEEPLPYVKGLRFFDFDEGLALTESTPSFPGGVLQTRDGGTTWTALSSPATYRWRTAAFVDLDHGILAGDLGQHALIARNQVVPPSLPGNGLQALYGVCAAANGRCWLAGDGAILLTSTDSGVSWETPPQPLPRELQDFVRFQTVAQQGDHVWVAGTPGKIIWHSPNQGQTWEPQVTESAAPLHKFFFRDSQRGCAVGTFGRILVTTDGGLHWTSVRGGERQAALFAMHAHPQRISLPLFVKQAHEEGYRTAVSLFTRDDIGPDAHTSTHQEVEVRSALLAAGVNEFATNWRLPLAVPGIARDRQRLLEDWTLLTDRRFAEVILGDLVAQIRTWRPAVIVIDEPPPDDAATLFLKQALEAAVAQAANPDSFSAQVQLAGLEPWQVEKVFVRLPVGSSGTTRVDPFDLLPRQHSQVGEAAEQAASRSTLEFTGPRQRHEFELLYAFQSRPGSGASFWGELSQPLTAHCRRRQLPLKEADLDQLAAQAQHMRTVAGITSRVVQEPAGSGHLLAQLNTLLAPLPDPEAAAQLLQLGQAYHAAGEWALAEETFATLIDRYPQQPVTAQAMKWLVMYWTSTELNWQRLRATGGVQSKTVDLALLQSDSPTEQQTAVDRQQALREGELQQALEISQSATTETERQQRLQDFFNNQGANPQRNLEQQTIIPTSGSVGSVLAASASGGTSAGGASATQRSQLLSRWLEGAHRLTERLQTAHPVLSEDPEFQFVVASLARRRNKSRQADEINTRFLQSLQDDPWAIAARGEAYLLRPGQVAPKPVVNAGRAVQPPVLDGLLSDPCWASAPEIMLQSEPENGEAEFVNGVSTRPKASTGTGTRTVIMLCHDAEYLYVAASVPREPQLPNDPPALKGRPRDADLRAYDRLLISLDCDRDYATTYEFEVDSRGWTREACWRDNRFNPEWFVAMEADDTVWRVEAAITLADLVPPGSHSGATWGVGLTRIMPGLGTESWTAAGGETPFPPRFGLLRLGH